METNPIPEYGLSREKKKKQQRKDKNNLVLSQK
jgi:hypothetical protein